LDPEAMTGPWSPGLTSEALQGQGEPLIVLWGRMGPPEATRPEAWCRPSVPGSALSLPEVGRGGSTKGKAGRPTGRPASCAPWG
jgi:hypothetical protein